MSRRMSHVLLPAAFISALTVAEPPTANAAAETSTGSDFIAAPSSKSPTIDTTITHKVYLDIGVCETAYKKDRAIGG